MSTGRDGAASGRTLPSLIRSFHAREKPLDQFEHFRGLVVLKPVARAVDLGQFGVPEMLQHAGGGGIGQKTLAAADQQRRTLDARPQPYVVFER